MKRALITGITGQDGSYLTEFLLDKGYEVHGIKRRSSSFNTQRLDHLYQDPHIENVNLKLHYGDLTDSSNLTRIIKDIEPDEVYNLGAQSHVAVSFDSPEYTADVDAMGTLRMLEAIRFLNLKIKHDFIKHQHLNYMAWCKKRPNVKRHHFIHVHLMQLLKCMRIGSQLITAKAMVCMRVMEFFLITNHRVVERLL